MSIYGITNFAKLGGVICSPRRLTDAEAEATRRAWEVLYDSGTIAHRHIHRRRVWLPDSFAAWSAAPWWALTWLLTFGRFGRLPWTWEEARVVSRWSSEPPGIRVPPPASFTGGYQPTVSNTDPSSPPRGGSGVPRR